MKRYIATLLLLATTLTAGAREVFPLNEGWRFYFKSETTSDNARHVNLPHSWNTDPMAEGAIAEATGNYLNNMHIPIDWSSKRIFVRFYGAQNVATLFVNGCYAGSHRGGATAFTFEITDKVRFGSDNALLVIVSNTWQGDVLPTSTDTNLYGGIYREAELIITDRTTISPLYLGTEGVLVQPTQVNAEAAEGNVEVHIASKGENACILTVGITDSNGHNVFFKRQRIKLDGRPVQVPFTVENPALWSPQSPTMYTVTAAIDDELYKDQVSIRTGFRTIGVTPTQRMQINGVTTPLRGVVLHHDNALSGGTLTATDYDIDLEMIRTLGANAIRSAVMPHAQHLYDRCDEQGMLVWIDMPFHRSPFLSDMHYFSTPQFEQNGIDQLREIIAQNINHPSVVMWGLFSHLWMRGDNVIPYLKRLNAAAHDLDSSRPTVACSNQDGEINFITDLIVWQQDVGWQKGSADDIVVWRDQLQKNWSQLRSAITYGGSGFIGHKSYTAQAKPLLNWIPEEMQTRFHEEYARNLQNDSLFWGVWINNMFDYGSARRPYGINAMGLVTLNRRDCKDAFYLYKALWNRENPTLHIVDKHRLLRDAPQQFFTVYSSAGTPTMLVGRDTVAMHAYSACQYRSDTVTVAVTVQGAMEVDVKVWVGELRDSVTIRVGNVLKPKRSRAPLRTTSLPRTN